MGRFFGDPERPVPEAEDLVPDVEIEDDDDSLDLGDADATHDKP